GRRRRQHQPRPRGAPAPRVGAARRVRGLAPRRGNSSVPPRRPLKTVGSRPEAVPVRSWLGGRAARGERSMNSGNGLCAAGAPGANPSGGVGVVSAAVRGGLGRPIATASRLRSPHTGPSSANGSPARAGLAHELKKRAASNASFLRSMWWTAPPSRAPEAPSARAARAPGAGALPRSCPRRASLFLACSLPRRNRAVASEKAHLRWALPILPPPVPFFLPADSWAQRTSRA